MPQTEDGCSKMKANCRSEKGGSGWDAFPLMSGREGGGSGKGSSRGLGSCPAGGQGVAHLCDCKRETFSGGHTMPKHHTTCGAQAAGNFGFRGFPQDYRPLRVSLAIPLTKQRSRRAGTEAWIERRALEKRARKPEGRTVDAT